MTQPSPDTSLTQNQFANSTNPTSIQKSTYESDTDDDSDNFVQKTLVTLHLTYPVNSQFKSEQQSLNDKCTVLSEKIPETQQP